MRNTAFEKTVAALEELRASGDPESAAPVVRKALHHKNNYVVSKAASVAAALRLRDLISDLLDAYARFFQDPVKSDPQCWAKNAIAQALAAFEYDDPEPFLRGLRHFQLEPVWGGTEDSAGTLRGYCARALVQTRILRLEALTVLVDALADKERMVRVEAARSIADLNASEGSLLLRLRALTLHPEDNETMGACFAGILAIEEQSGIPFVKMFLDRGEAEAALALGESRLPGVLAILQAMLDRQGDPETRRAVLAGIALTRLPEAFDCLVRIVETDRLEKTSALEALGYMTLTPEQQARLQAATRQT